MRYRDLIVQEGMFGSQQGARAMVQSMIMALTARGITEIPTATISEEIRRKMRMNIPMSELVDMLSSMPNVSSADRESVTLRDEDAEMQNVGQGDAKDQVANMATNGVKADKTF